MFKEVVENSNYKESASVAVSLTPVIRLTVTAKKWDVSTKLLLKHFYKGICGRLSLIMKERITAINHRRSKRL